ncbi:MAG: WecB/TagA/CpsF family glycosyltransferase, partial [Dermatophilaceae bacterium]
MLHHISVATTSGEKTNLLQEIARGDGPVVVSFINAHGANLAWSDPAFRDAMLASDVLLRDGVGMSMLMRMLHQDPGLNLNGTDLIPEILRTNAHRRIALAGTTSTYVETAARRLRSLYG